MTDINKISLSSFNSSLKVIDTIPGSISVPPTSSSVDSVVAIPHGQNSTNVIPQVVANAPLYGITQYFTLPYTSADGRESLDVYVDKDYVYIKANSTTVGSPTLGIDYNYYLTIIIP